MKTYIIYESFYYDTFTAILICDLMSWIKLICRKISIVIKYKMSVKISLKS